MRCPGWPLPKRRCLSSAPPTRLRQVRALPACSPRGRACAAAPHSLFFSFFFSVAPFAGAGNVAAAGGGGGDDDDDDDDDDEDDAAGGAGGAGGKQNRSEKKARKALLKLGLKPVTQVSKVTVKKSKQVRA